MKNEFLKLLDRKLVLVLGETDERVCSSIRNEWKVFSPAPNCPAVGKVTESIKYICHNGYREREKVAKIEVDALLSNYGNLLNRKMIGRIEIVLNKHFPEDKYVSLSASTVEVFKRINAPESRLDSRVVQLNMSLIQTGAANMSRRSIHELNLIVRDHELRKRLASNSIFKKPVSFFSNFIVLPSIKWIWGIVTGIIVGVTVFWLRDFG